MRRRTLVVIAVVTLLGASAPVIAQPSQRIPRIGILTPADTERTPLFEAFRAGLRDLGYVEGRNVMLEFRFAHGDSSLLPRLAGELVDLPVDAILVDGGPGVVRAVMGMTKRIPIVLATGGDPVMSGVVSSLSHPGGNVTGFTLGHSELNGKRVDVLKDAFPGILTIAVLINSSNANAAEYLKEADEAAREIGIEKVLHIPVANLQELMSLKPTAFIGVGGVVVLPDVVFWNHRSVIVTLLAAAHLPAIYPEREYAEDGGLMAYGANVPENFRRAADYIDRILKGTDPGSLPIQEPSKFDFVVNLKTAKELGVTIPQSILLRGEVIE